MICVFEAPDAEAVRRTASELGYKYDRLWPATIVRLTHELPAVTDRAARLEAVRFLA
jgi:hypothetical protein